MHKKLSTVPANAILAVVAEFASKSFPSLLLIYAGTVATVEEFARASATATVAIYLIMLSSKPFEQYGQISLIGHPGKPIAQLVAFVTLNKAAFGLLPVPLIYYLGSKNSNIDADVAWLFVIPAVLNLLWLSTVRRQSGELAIYLLVATAGLAGSIWLISSLAALDARTILQARVFVEVCGLAAVVAVFINRMRHFDRTRIQDRFPSTLLTDRYREVFRNFALVFLTATLSGADRLIVGLTESTEKVSAYLWYASVFAFSGLLFHVYWIYFAGELRGLRAHGAARSVERKRITLFFYQLSAGAGAFVVVGAPAILWMMNVGIIPKSTPPLVLSQLLFAGTQALLGGVSNVLYVMEGGVVAANRTFFRALAVLVPSMLVASHLYGAEAVATVGTAVYAAVAILMCRRTLRALSDD